MKRGVITFIILLLVGHTFCQKQDDKVKCEVEVNQFITGSGFATGTELYFKLLDNEFHRTVAFGLFYDIEYCKITGVSIHHEVALCRKNLEDGIIKPYVFYNFIYRKTTIPEIGPDLESNGDLATYTSLEHHFGAGVKLKLSKKIYMNFDFGYGVYLGSIKKPTAFNSITGEVRGSDGFGMIAQVGIGYKLF